MPVEDNEAHAVRCGHSPLESRKLVIWSERMTLMPGMAAVVADEVPQVLANQHAKVGSTHSQLRHCKGRRDDWHRAGPSPPKVVSAAIPDLRLCAPSEVHSI